MSYKIGNKYFFDQRIEKINCVESGRLVDDGYITGNNGQYSGKSFFIKHPISGQILTLKMGVETWVNPYYDIYKITSYSETESLTHVLKSGANLYTQYFGIEPYSISATNLPPGLVLKSYNRISGIPTQIGSYNCNLIYQYCASSGYTAITRPITINIYSGSEETIQYNKIFNSNLGPQFNFDTSIEFGTSTCGYKQLSPLILYNLNSIASGQKLTLEKNNVITGYDMVYAITGWTGVITGYLQVDCSEYPVEYCPSGEPLYSGGSYPVYGFITGEALYGTTSQAWLYPSNSEEYIASVGPTYAGGETGYLGMFAKCVNMYTFSLAPGTNLYTKKYENGINPSLIINSSYLKYLDNFSDELDPDFPLTNGLPANLSYKAGDWRTITGIPTEYGNWKCFITLGYCNAPNTITGETKTFDLEVIPSELIEYRSGPTYVSFSSGNSYNLVETENIEFLYIEDNRFKKFINKITGYGDMNLSGDFSNTPYYGYISGLTGYLPAVTYIPVTLSGIIGENESTMIWNDVYISREDYELNGDVYVDRITGYVQAKNSIIIDTDLLTYGDYVSFNDINFYYASDPEILNQSYYYFSTLSGLISTLNSGALGRLDDITLEQILGITGYVDGSTLNLFSYRITGEDGNYIKISKTVENPNSINIPNRYFSGGKTLRPPSNTWSGYFETNYPIIIGETSGFYEYTYINENYTQNINTVMWDDTFSGNYYITTGIYNTDNVESLSGSLVPFIPSLGIYSGYGFIPSGQSIIPTGFSISILKPNFYNIQGNIAKYTVEGEDFLYTGLIQG
jgi:hypothetical protein